jgi:uncharacterized membrane protein
MWATRFRIRQFVHTSLWLLPLLSGVLGMALGSFGLVVDDHLHLPPYWLYTSSTASTVLTAIVSSTAALLGFVVTVSVLGVQMTTGTFSARYMRLWYRDRALKAVLALLVGTLTFSFALLRRVHDEFVPSLGVTTAGMLLLASVLLFVVFFGRFLHRLRPVAIAAVVARAGQRAFADVARQAASADAPTLVVEELEAVEEPALVVRSTRAGSVQAVHGRGLVEWAAEHECRLVLPHWAGDFVAADETLIEVYGDGAFGSADADRLRGMVALGIERTIEQDPAFAIRIMVDIANRALSAAINDPTTAVQVIDHLGELLRTIGTTEIRGPRPSAESSAPGVVLVRARRWEDILALAMTEIREYGAGSVQINRRLRALLEELHAKALPGYRAAVEDELARLDAGIARQFALSPDLDRARASDRQGIGGASRPAAVLAAAASAPDDGAGGR